MSASAISPKAIAALAYALTPLLGAPTIASEVEAQWRWQDVDRVIAFGDVHGDYAALHRLLSFAQVIDARDRWIAGETHLVSLGDLLDRGPDSRQVMDLLMSLEPQAEAAGGRVHVLIGNHEQMNLTGDLRYVAPEEFAAFAGTDDDALRAAALADARAAGLRDSLILDRPPGFFAHRAAFSAEGTYGRWLLSLNIIAVINDTAYVHGGLFPRGAPATEWIPTQRATLREATALRAAQPLQRADLLHRDVLELGRPDGRDSLPRSVTKALGKRLERVAQAPLFADTGPLWYRGNAGCHKTLESAYLDTALRELDATRVAVGHTPQADHRIRQRLDGRVLMLDTGMLHSHYGGEPRALLLERGQAPRVLSPSGGQGEVTVQTPAVNAGRPPAALARLLTYGTLARGEGEDLATVTLDGASVQVRVLPWGPRERRRAIAADRVDEQLALGFVPAVAERGEGREGVLLRVSEGRWLSEATRKRQNRRLPNWCSTGHAFALVRLYDALVGHSRRPQELSYAVPSYAIRLTGHNDAFLSTASKVAAPELPAQVALDLLERLAPPFQQEALADLLSRSQLRAFEARRQTLLEHYARR